MTSLCEGGGGRQLQSPNTETNNFNSFIHIHCISDIFKNMYQAEFIWQQRIWAVTNGGIFKQEVSGLVKTLTFFI